MKDKTFLKIAAVIAEDSKCVSLKVGCVLVLDGHIISTGINGTPKGFTNCCDKFDERGEEHSAWSEKFEIHAEMSSLIYCPVDTKGSTAYITHAPCFNCCKHLVAAGVKEIHYTEKYYRMPEEGLREITEFCKSMEVHIEKI